MIGKFSRILATVSVVATGAVKADEPQNGELTTVSARYLFVPTGFDDNDEVELVVDGYLPSGCYRLASPEIAVDHDARRVTIKPMARYFDVPCIEALIPYHFTAALGQLAAGVYAVEAPGPDATLTETLPVKHAVGPDPDDFLYAPVDDVKVERRAVTGELVATIRGRFTSSCMQWSEARVFDHGKTVDVLPILTLSGPDDCDAVETPYEQAIPLPGTITRGRHLLHVRSLNGKAVNQLFIK